MRLVFCFIFGSFCIVFSLTMLFEVVKINDIFRYCEQNNLMLIDEICTEEMINYGMGLFIAGIWIGTAGMVFIMSVLIAPDLPEFGRGEGMKV